MPTPNPNIVLLSALPTPMARIPPKPASLIALLSPLFSSMPRMATPFACPNVWLSSGRMLTLTPTDACLSAPSVRITMLNPIQEPASLSVQPHPFFSLIFQPDSAYQCAPPFPPSSQSTPAEFAQQYVPTTPSQTTIQGYV